MMRAFSLRGGLVVALALTFSALTGSVLVAQSAPQLGKPRPAPPGPSNMPPLPPAVFDETLAIGGDDIEARKARSRMTVEVRVNGQGPYRFLVDSGADTSVVGLRIARDLRLPIGTPVILNGMTARHIVDRVKVSQLSLGPSTIHNLELPALREGDLGADGMLGIDALVAQRLMMDFEDLAVKVEDARTPARVERGEIVITAHRRRGQLILTEVKAGSLTLDAVVDTGTEITIGNSALRDKLVRRGREKFYTVPTTGVTGVTVNLELATIGELKLGPIILRNVPVAFADVPPFKVFGLSDTPALLLGTDILETFRRVSLDFQARKIRFQLRKCGSTGVALSTSPTSKHTSLSTRSMEACRR